MVLEFAPVEGLYVHGFEFTLDPESDLVVVVRIEGTDSDLVVFPPLHLN